MDENWLSAIVGIINKAFVSEIIELEIIEKQKVLIENLSSKIFLVLTH